MEGDLKQKTAFDGGNPLMDRKIEATLPSLKFITIQSNEREKPKPTTGV